MWRVLSSASWPGLLLACSWLAPGHPRLFSLKTRKQGVDGRDKPTSVRHSLCLSCRLLHGDGCTRDSTTVRRPRCVRPKIKLRLFWRRRRRWFEKFRDRPPLHQVGPDEPREGERACNDFVGLMGETQQQESDQRDRDLNAHGIFGGSEEVSDLQGLLD